MIVYSFFLKYDQTRSDEFDFIAEFSHCLKKNYKGFHPVINYQDGSYLILYAMTTSKKFRDIFLSTRNMKLFKYYKTEIASDKFKPMKQNLNRLMLREDKLIDIIDGDIIKTPTVLTVYEHERINDDEFVINKIQGIFRREDKLPLIEYDILVNDFEKFLNKIQLQKSIDLLSFSGANDCDLEYYGSEYHRVMDSFKDNIVIKTLEVFLDLFGNTLKEI